MYHKFECENCGDDIETHCFDTRDNHRTYFTPPYRTISSSDALTESEVETYFTKIMTSAVTVLCIKCVLQ